MELISDNVNEKQQRDKVCSTTSMF
jgi:hypothetical protein